jgi:hypothetical protein
MRCIVKQENGLENFKHSIVSIIGGVSAAIEHMPSNPQLSERLLKLAMQKLSALVDGDEHRGQNIGSEIDEAE